MLSLFITHTHAYVFMSLPGKKQLVNLRTRSNFPHKNYHNFTLHASFYIFIYFENTKILQTIKYTHDLLQLAQLGRLTTSKLLGTQVKFLVSGCSVVDWSSECCIYGLILGFWTEEKICHLLQTHALGSQQSLSRAIALGATSKFCGVFVREVTNIKSQSALLQFMFLVI